MSPRLITVVETALFQRQASAVWEDEEREQFIDFIALHSEDGNVIPETGGVRKIRWSTGGGKRGGARVVYFSIIPINRFTC